MGLAGFLNFAFLYFEMFNRLKNRVVNAKVKVLVDISALAYANTGIRTYVTELLNELYQRSSEESGVDYVVVPSMGIIEKLSFFRRPYLSFLPKIAFHGGYFFWKQIGLPLAVTYHQADAVLCPDFVSPFWKLKALKISVIHDAFFWQHPSNYSMLWRRYYIASIRRGLRGRSVVVTTSNYSREAISGYLKYSGPIEVVYQCASSFGSIGQGSSGLERVERLGLQSNMYILHVGYFDKRKNLETLVKAYDLFIKQSKGDVKLVLAGGPAVNATLDDYDRIENLVQVLGLRDRVIMPGHVDDNLLVALYHHALMYVFPSLNEGFGIPVLEAMAFNIPVIVSEHGALKEIGGNAVISFNTFDHNELSARIHTLAIKEKFREDLVDKGRQRLAQFSRRSFLDGIENTIVKHVR